MHAVKTAVHGGTLSLGSDLWLLGGLLGIAMVTGTLAGNRFLRRASPAGFERYVLVLLVMVAICLIVAG